MTPRVGWLIALVPLLACNPAPSTNSSSSSSGSSSTSTPSSASASASSGAASSSGAAASSSSTASSSSSAAASSAAAASASSSSGGGNVLPLGTVANVSACPPTGTLPNTTCTQLTVRCPMVDDHDVRVLVSLPPDGTAVRGTIMFGTGGGGTGYYQGSAEAAAMLERVRVAGFVVVQRAWAGDWEGTTAGMARAACRYSTLLQWVHDNVHTVGGFCATGNSGGASEIAYALSRFGRDSILDFAVPTGGPPMGRMDHGCPGTTTAGWSTDCAMLLAQHADVCATTSCTFSQSGQSTIDEAYTGTPCANGPAAEGARLREDSVYSADAQLGFAIPIHVVLGTQDCTEAVTLGLAWYVAVTSEKSLEFAANTPHPVFSTVAGAAAIEAALVGPQGCVPRP